MTMDCGTNLDNLAYGAKFNATADKWCCFTLLTLLGVMVGSLA